MLNFFLWKKIDMGAREACAAITFLAIATLVICSARYSALVVLDVVIVATLGTVVNQTVVYAGKGVYWEDTFYEFTTTPEYSENPGKESGVLRRNVDTPEYRDPGSVDEIYFNVCRYDPSIFYSQLCIDTSFGYDLYDSMPFYSDYIAGMVISGVILIATIGGFFLYAFLVGRKEEERRRLCDEENRPKNVSEYVAPPAFVAEVARAEIVEEKAPPPYSYQSYETYN